jgi:hypothetical protein
VVSVWMQYAGGPHNLVFAPRRRSRTSNPVLRREPEALIEIDFVDAGNQSWLLANPPWFPRELRFSGNPAASRARCVCAAVWILLTQFHREIQSTVTS